MNEKKNTQNENPSIKHEWKIEVLSSHPLFQQFTKSEKYTMSTCCRSTYFVYSITIF